MGRILLHMFKRAFETICRSSYLRVALLDFIFGQVVEVSVGEHFGNSDQNSSDLEVVMEKDEDGP